MPASPLSLRFRRRARTGFTLIELLCVVTIIGLLANLAFPAFQSAMAKAKSSACGSNLGQIGVAVTLAAQDNNNTYPNIESDPTTPVYPPGTAQDLLTTLLPYGLVTNNVKCPSDLQGGPNYFKQKGSSYQWRPFLDGEIDGAANVYFGANAIPVASGKVVVAFDFSNVHRGRSNRLYGDGRVIWK